MHSSRLSFRGVDIEVRSSLSPPLSGFLIPKVLAAVSGAPDGSVVRVAQEGIAIVMSVEHPLVGYMRRQIFFRDGKGLLLSNQRVRLPANERGQYFLGRSINRQLNEIDTSTLHPSLAISMFSTQVDARNGGEHEQEHEVGYTLLPQLGFDAEIPDLQSFRKAFPSSPAVRLSEIVLEPELKSWWAYTGHKYSFGLTFDLATGSLSRKILGTYIQNNCHQFFNETSS